MADDGRDRIIEIGQLLDRQLDRDLVRRIGSIADGVRLPVEPITPVGPVGPGGPGRPPVGPGRPPVGPGRPPIGPGRPPVDPLPPPDRLTPGTPGPDRHLPVKELGSLVRRAVAGDRRRIIWTARGNEALVLLDTMRLALDHGLVFVALTLETTQTGPQELTTVLAVGAKDRPAGLLAVAEERPRGHGALAATFAEPVIATAWRGLLLVVAAVAASAGRDADGDPLVPFALTATPDLLVVHTIADHRLGKPTRR